jgi:hypothetical protein
MLGKQRHHTANFAACGFFGALLLFFLSYNWEDPVRWDENPKQ